MPEVISCPDCDRKLRVPETMLGKKVKCPGCQTIFVAKAGGDDEEEDKPAPKAASKSPSKSPAKSNAIEETPRKRPAPPPDEEDEEDEDRPARRKSRRDEEDEDEDEDDRPARRKGRDEEDEEEDEDDQEDEDEDEDRPKRKTGSWTKVNSGLMFVLISLFVLIGGAFIAPLIGMIFTPTVNFGPGGPRVGGGGYYFGVILNKLIAYSWMGLNLTGHFFMMSVPDRRGVNVKGLALITFIAVATYLGCTIVVDIITFAFLGAAFAGGGFPFMMGGGGIGGMFYALIAFSVLSLLAYATSGITFCLELRGISQAMGNQGLAKQVFTFLIVAVSTAVAAVVILGLLFLIMGAAVWGAFGGAGMGGGPPNQAAAQALGGSMIMACGAFCLLGVATLGEFVWYIIILFQVRSAVTRGMRR